jgi:3-polyprenyl-4-hydroxybenzoate decarboxylase
MDLLLKNVKKKDLPVLKALAKRLDFEIEVQEKPYNPEFVKEILDAQQSIKDGKGIKMTIEELDKLWK